MHLLTFCDTGEWDGLTGYIQDALKSEKLGVWPLKDSAKAAVVLCGQKEMAMDVTALFTEAGVDGANILTNF